MNRDELIAAILPELGKVPMVDAPQSRIREIQAGWIADAIISRLQPSGDGEPVAERLANIVRKAGYWSAEIVLGTDGGHDVTLLTKEGYDAIRALAGKDEA